MGLPIFKVFLLLKSKAPFFMGFFIFVSPRDFGGKILFFQRPQLIKNILLFFFFFFASWAFEGVGFSKIFFFFGRGGICPRGPG